MRRTVKLPAALRTPWLLWTVIGIAALGLLKFLVWPLIGAMCPGSFRGSAQIVVRNTGRIPVSTVSLALTCVGDEAEIHELPALLPGEHFAIRPKSLDVDVNLSYAVEGKKCSHQVFVDLWTGETYAFEISDGAEVHSGYDHGHGIIGGRDASKSPVAP